MTGRPVESSARSGRRPSRGGWRALLMATAAARPVRQPWTYAQAGTIMGQFVGALKSALPNALLSMDISPWVGTNNNTGSNGSDNGRNWYSNFDMTQFTFINTPEPPTHMWLHRGKHGPTR